MKKDLQREIPTYWGTIPAEVRYSKLLTPMEKVIYSELTALSSTTGRCWPTNKYFAELYDVQPTTVSEWINNLKRNGFISVRGAEDRKRVITLVNVLRKKPKTSSEKAEKTPSEKVEYNSTSNNINNNIAAVAENKGFNSLEYFKEITLGKNLNARITAYFGLKKGSYLKCKNRVEANAFIFSPRLLAVAKRLLPFGQERIIKAIEECENLNYGGQKVNWTLETVEKQLLK